MAQTIRYERFEAVTVRAAARVLRLSRRLSLCEAEQELYLRELVVLDAHATGAARPALRRLARRRSPLGGPARAECGRPFPGRRHGHAAVPLLRRARVALAA